MAVLELPFSNAWIASQTASKLPANSVLHLGIQNSLRFWNFYETPECVACFSNTGGFGIDGSMNNTAQVMYDRLYDRIFDNSKLLSTFVNFSLQAGI